MNDPNNIKLNFDDLVEWMKAYRERHSLSWPQLALRMNQKRSTISLFQSPSFNGNKDNASKIIYAFKQMVESQEAREAVALEEVPWIPTKTAEGLLFLMEWAHRGKMTAGALGSGLGKTKTAEHYKSCMGDTVALVKLTKTDKTASALLTRIMRAMNLPGSTGWASQRFAQIEEHVRNRRQLLIVDEANNLDLDGMEILRGLHDNAGLGVCMLGNEELLERIRGGARNHAYARLNRRIKPLHVQDLPFEEDITAFLDANRIDDPQMIAQLMALGLDPAQGGLGGIWGVLEDANLRAIAAETVLSVKHIKAAIGAITIDARRRR